METMSNAVVYLVLLVCFSHLGSAQGCGDGWVRYRESCYIYQSDPYSWFDAKVTCDTLGGKLVEIESAVESRFIKNMISAHNPGFVWIGLEDFALKGEYTWASTQEIPEFTKWKTGEPNNVGGHENCVVMQPTTEGWLDVHCENQKFTFVCELENESPVIG